MKRKRNLTTHLLRMLRKVGMLCKKPVPQKPKLKIQKSVDADGNDISHDDLMFAKNILYGINNVGKNKKMCHYDFRKHTCRCGMTIEKLKAGEHCSIKK